MSRTFAVAGLVVVFVGSAMAAYAIVASRGAATRKEAEASPAHGTAARDAAAQTRTPRHAVPSPTHGGTVVQLCDGETTAEVDGAMTADKARAVSSDLMAQWRAKNPGAYWDDDAIIPERDGIVLAQATPPGAAHTATGKQAQSGAPGTTKPQQADIGESSARDQKLWAQETARFIGEGDKIFHDAKALGGTVSISCDMCHPNAANTHPETYPKFQTQFGRVALLRDMINWCIENPVKGKPMKDDDPKLRALEAYILAQRKGVPLEYGKH